MSENDPPAVWPPVHRQYASSMAPQTLNLSSSTTPARLPQPTQQDTLSSPLLQNITPVHRAPLTTTMNNSKKLYRNGFEAKPQTPSYKPYALNSRGWKRQHSYAFDDEKVCVKPMKPPSCARWNELAVEARILPDGCALWDFQMQCSDIVVEMARDVCVISPTGSGKSLLWLLPLLVQKDGISLVITPYTSLGIEGQERHVSMSYYWSLLLKKNYPRLLIGLVTWQYRQFLSIRNRKKHSCLKIRPTAITRWSLYVSRCWKGCLSPKFFILKVSKTDYWAYTLTKPI
jgi:hypothetical protein